jgi:argininosuccinate lyase
LALKLHAARSRNDQVVFSTKFSCKETIPKLKLDVQKLINAIINLGIRNKDIIIPGFTHLQHAQPVYLKDYLAAYADMLQRDVSRMGYIADNLKLLIGSGALAGTPISVEQYTKGVEKFLKEQKEFVKEFNIEVTKNSLDSVSDRDFVIEIISALSIIAMHLSRLSEDLIIWSTKEFDFVEIDESFCTGSSLMPQKKNPDVLELIRGYSGRLFGNLVNVLTMMKGLPLTYNRDMQLDKESLFESFEIIFKEVELLKHLISSLKFNEDIIKKHLEDESLYATDLVYYLVHKKVPFKEAHDIVGKLYRYSIDNKIDIKKLPEPVLKEHAKEFVKDEILELFDPKRSVESKISIKRE